MGQAARVVTGARPKPFLVVVSAPPPYVEATLLLCDVPCLRAVSAYTLVVRMVSDANFCAAFDLAETAASSSLRRVVVTWSSEVATVQSNSVPTIVFFYR